MPAVKYIWSDIGGVNYLIKHVLCSFLLIWCLFFYQPPIYIVLNLTYPLLESLLDTVVDYYEIIFVSASRDKGTDNEWDIHEQTSVGVTVLCSIFTAFMILRMIVLVVSLLACPLFEKKPTLHRSLLSADIPYLCIRVCTKGFYSDLVKTTMRKNVLTCLNLGMQPDKFHMEIVTLTPLDLPGFIGDISESDPIHNVTMREILVPQDYKLPNGSIFKCRNLQYALEENANKLSSGDYILHIDEETLVTPSSLTACINSMCEGRLDFAQGLVTYTKYGRINNMWTTLCDLIRVSSDLGITRFFASYYECCFFGWKGSWMLGKYDSVKQLGFDYGRNYSIAEDCYMSLKASSLGYKLGWIGGEMLEESPYTFSDLLKQRTRWMHGIAYIVFNTPADSGIYWPYHLASLTMFLSTPLSILIVTLRFFSLIEVPLFTQSCLVLMGRLHGFTLMLATMKSFSIKRDGLIKFSAYFFLALLTPPINILVNGFAVCRGVFAWARNIYSFETVQKAAL